MKLTRVLLIALFLSMGSASFALTTDTDGDGIEDAADNCLLVENASQVDTDSDSWGNACDPDFNNDSAVNFLDFAMLSNSFLSNEALYDLNNDGVVNFLDVAVFASFFNGAPGPAGFALAQGGAWCASQNWLPRAFPTASTHVFVENIDNLFFCESIDPQAPPSNNIDVASINIEGDLNLFVDPSQPLTNIQSNIVKRLS